MLVVAAVALLKLSLLLYRYVFTDTHLRRRAKETEKKESKALWFIFN